MDSMVYKIQGQGIISVVNDSDVEYLEIDNKIIAINISGPFQHSYNSYFIKGDFHSEYINSYLKNVGFDFYTQKDLLREYSSDVERFLKIFEGETFYLNQITKFHIAEFNYENRLIFWGDFRDTSQILLFTRERESLCREVIDFYKEKINQGNKPIVLCYTKSIDGGTGESYIIDGHHKLIAYKELGQTPLMWEIVSVGHHNYDQIDKPRVEHILQNKIEAFLRKHVC